MYSSSQEWENCPYPIIFAVGRRGTWTTAVVPCFIPCACRNGAVWNIQFHLFLWGIEVLCSDNSRFFLSLLSFFCIWGQRRKLPHWDNSNCCAHYLSVVAGTFPKNRAHQDLPNHPSWLLSFPVNSLCPQGFRLNVTYENTTWNLFPKMLFICLGRFAKYS